MTVHESIIAAVRKLDATRDIQIMDVPGVPLCPDVPHVVFTGPDDFEAGFQTIAAAKFGNLVLIQVYLKTAVVAAPGVDGAPATTQTQFVAEFAIPR